MLSIAQAAPEPALPGWLQYFLLWWGALTAAGAVIATVRATWRRGPGRRHVLEEQLRQIVAGGQLAHVVGIFGPAQFVQHAHPRHSCTHQPVHIEVHSWVSSDHVFRCYVDDGIVVTWVVTSRTRAFTPTWQVGNHTITLHHSTLAEVGNGVGQHMLGANWFGYAEDASLGRGTWYQDVSIGVSDEGLLGPYGELLDAMQHTDADGNHLPIEENIAAIRGRVSFDTVAVSDRGAPQDPLSLPLSTSFLQRVQPRIMLRKRLRDAIPELRPGSGRVGVARLLDASFPGRWEEA